MKSSTEKLNEKLFQTIDELLQKENPIDVHRANAVSKAAKAIVDNERNAIAKMKLMQKFGVQEGTAALQE